MSNLFPEIMRLTQDTCRRNVVLSLSGMRKDYLNMWKYYVKRITSPYDVTVIVKVFIRIRDVADTRIISHTHKQSYKLNSS